MPPQPADRKLDAGGGESVGLSAVKHRRCRRSRGLQEAEFTQNLLSNSVSLNRSKIKIIRTRISYCQDVRVLPMTDNIGNNIGWL
jgi:hypothetical protein